jgi:hypothetical protein
MDIFDVLSEIQDERQRLDKVITMLEYFAGPHAECRVLAVETRGRKYMPLQERMRASQRMKEYWARKRTEGVETVVYGPAQAGSGAEAKHDRTE